MDASLLFSNTIPFAEKAIQVFRYQAAENMVYKRYLEAINCNPARVTAPAQIPFLPISFFKNFLVAAGKFKPEAVFTSSGTTGAATSRHPVKSLRLYEESFRAAFELFYGPVSGRAILGLLPSYLERDGSSLVYMVQQLITWSGHPQSGFYLYDFGRLAHTLAALEAAGQPTLLIGVTYALLDFAAAFPAPLQHTVVMETGGMKGRKKEQLRAEVHAALCAAFGVQQVHSEYGMTELLSQAYAPQGGLFKTPPWMRAVLREEDDPFAVHFETDKHRTGALNLIDLANLHSCAFIATDDVARLHPDGRFEVLGRMDGSDVRGCSLLAL